jgi:hypothetical protein
LQPQHNVFRSELLAGIDSVRRSVDLGGVLENLAAQCPIDESRIISVVIEEDRGSADEEKQQYRKKDFKERGTEKIKNLPRVYVSGLRSAICGV